MKTDIDNVAAAASRSWLVFARAYGYQTTLAVGRLRLHVFHKEDPGEAYHDHPWPYWTFPLTSYVEQVLVPGTGGVYRQLVPARRWSRREADHAHRIVGRWDGGYDERGEPTVGPGVIVTVVWRGAHERAWSYLLLRPGYEVRRVSPLAYLRRVEKHPKEAA